jgi:radical SAM protein with 4Fe4S-binding SPASM domain
MYLAPKDIEEYREYSRRHFGCDYPELNGWRREDDDKYLAVLKEEKEKIAMERYPLPVYFMPHTYPENPEAHHCGNAWTRVHIRHDGEVGFCTDYFGFSAGNILQNTLTEIWRGERAELFRRAVETDSLAICRHCPWHMQRTLTQPS